MSEDKKSEKQVQAELLNVIEGKVQGIFFDLDAFSNYDNGSVAQNTILKLVEELVLIKRNILKKPDGEDKPE